MIEVIIERQVKKGEDISPLLREIRAAAIHCPGHVAGKTLINTEDSGNIVVVSTWETLEDWKVWETSETRARLCQRIEPLLAEKPKARTYMLMATEERA